MTGEEGWLLTLLHAEALPASIAGPTAVDDGGGAVDEAAAIGFGEEEDGLGDVVGGGEASHGVDAFDVGVGVGATGGLIDDVHLGLDPAGADCIHADAATAPFCGE